VFVTKFRIESIFKFTTESSIDFIKNLFLSYCEVFKLQEYTVQ